LHVLAHLRLGWLDEGREAWVPAKEHYEHAAQLDPNNVQAALRLGMVHFQLGETGPAIFQLQRALELDPSNLDTHYYLYAIYRRAKMESEALEQLRIIKAGESAAKLLELFDRHGQEHFRLGRYAEAVDDYELALQFDPGSIPLYIHLGDLYYLQQQPHTALETWLRGLYAGYSAALAERVLAVSVEAVDVWPVISLVRDCAARHPQDGRYRYLLAQLVRRAGQEEESVHLLEIAVRQSPQLLAAQQDLGDVYSAVGQEAKAGATYRAGLAAARAGEAVYRCRVCGYVTEEEQPRCFQCNRWGVFESMSRAVTEGRATIPQRLLGRMDAVRQGLRSLRSKIAGQLPPGH